MGTPGSNPTHAFLTSRFHLWVPALSHTHQGLPSGAPSPSAQLLVSREGSALCPLPEPPLHPVLESLPPRE